MIGLGFYNSLNTSLDINGPFLRFIDQPVSATAIDEGGITFSATAIAEFKHNPTIPGDRVTNTGEIEYQWYVDNVAVQDIPNSISGSQTNQITLSNLSSPEDDGKVIFLRATYKGSAYQTGEGELTETNRRLTGNAVNQPLDSDSVTLSMNPVISIITQPADAVSSGDNTAIFGVVASSTDNSDVLYQWSLDGVPLTDSATVSGSNTNTLSILKDVQGTYEISVTVSHPTASNSPITSDIATLTVTIPRNIINFLDHDGDGNEIGSTIYNVFETSFRITADPNNPDKITTFHAPEKDITVKLTMAGSSGESNNGFTGGRGGQSQFVIDLEKNQEYALILGSSLNPAESSNGGGGGAYLYKKGRLLVALGGGGGAGSNGKGGKGGGIGIEGESGVGRNAGSGGSTIPVGSLTTLGEYSTDTIGGRVSGCTIGSDWFVNRYSPCEDYGFSKFLNYDGIIMEDSPQIQRGFKPGVAHRNNGGNGTGLNGGGGSGANGGNAASSNGSGGGGGSGYSNGEVTVINANMGGNVNNNAFVTFEYYTP